MEHKAWLWRRKSSEKTSVVNIKKEEEAKKTQELERSLKGLTEKLTSALTESNAKDDLLAKHIKVAEEALAGWEKTETEAASFKQELDDALQCKVTAEERIVNLDAALKECMQKLHIVQEEQKQMISDSAVKAVREKEKTRILEERLADLSKQLAKLGSDNSSLNKVLEVKEKMIKDLTERKSQTEANINALVARLDSSEENNGSLKYEVCMLEKELEIRKEEKEFNLKSVDAAHKQHLESIKKIAKLEAECQRLRVMVRKRLPGPAAVAKMKSEVGLLGRDANEMLRKKSYSSVDGLMARDIFLENGHDSSMRRGSLIDRLIAMEEENRILKETLTKKNSELQSSRVMCARTASKLSQAETQLEELSKGQTVFDLARSSPVSCDMPLASISEDGGNEDNISCAESWASALISELEHFRNGKPMTPSSKTSGIPDLDDFVEMERLAIVSVDKPVGNSHSLSSEHNTCVALSELDKDLVPLSTLSDISISNPETQSSSVPFEKSPNWLKDILRVILQKHHITQISLDVILEEVRVSLFKMGHFVRGKPLSAVHVNGNISQMPQHRSSDSFDGTFGSSMFISEKNNPECQSNLDKSIRKLVELIEGISERTSTDYDSQPTLSRNDENIVPQKKSPTLNGYISRVFQWKSSELGAVLRQFTQTCNDMLQQKANPENFVGELASTLEWIISHCFSLQDVSSMKETIKKHLDWDESHSESELEIGPSSPHREAEKLCAPEECKHAMKTTLHVSVTANGLDNVSKREEIESKLKDENRKLKHTVMNVESLKNDLEEKLGSAMTKNESLSTQLQASEQTILSLQVDLGTLKESKGLIEEQIENQKLLKQELDTRFSVAKAQLNEARQKFSSLEVALEDKSNCCEELEATCLELQLQLESVAKESPKYDMDQDQNQLRRNWEISAASEKLAECQETILNLGKQLKALASPRDAVLFDKVMSTPANSQTNHTHPPALLDQMLAEDDLRQEELKSPKTKEIICTNPQKSPQVPPGNPNAGLLYGRKILPSHGANNPMTGSIQASPIMLPGKFYGLDESNKHKSETDAGVLAIVPKRQKSGGNLLRRLLTKRKKGGNKKLLLRSVS